MKATHFLPWVCRCGYKMDAASSLHNEDHVPSEGDLTVCMNCAEPYRMHKGLWMPLTDDELIEMPLEVKQQLSEVQIAVRKARREHQLREK